MPKIKFGSARPYNDENDQKITEPGPVKNFLPDWWKNASRWWLGEDGKPLSLPEDEKPFGFKSCPALLDIFSTGYVLRTPTDIMFVQHNNVPYLIIDNKFKEFCGERIDMPQFPVPQGYSKKHFHWWPNWGIELPEGYSSLVTHPLNRYDLPFLTTNGIIDSDRYPTPGLTPFFLKEGFSGLIPKGTPFAQIIPIKRENWDSEMVYYSEEEILNRHNKTADMYRVKSGGIYKRKTWVKKNYE